MRFSWIPLLLVAGTATAAPSADLVIGWTPGANPAAVATVARASGAAFLDRSPAAEPVGDLAPVIRRGIDAYDGLRFDEARSALDAARAAIDRSGAAGLTTTQLSDLFVYRALVATQAGDTAAAWDELITAVVVAPSRVLDPARFPPRVVADLARAQATVATRAHATLTVAAPEGCAIAIDGAEATTVVAGAHWVNVACADHAPWGSRVDVAAPATTITARPAAYAPPSDADVLIQARTASARAVIVVELHGTIATVRLVGADGRERERRSVTTAPDLAAVADAVRELLLPTAEVTHWYRSRWTWAAAAAVIAAAILIPVTTAIVHDSRASSASVQITPPAAWTP